MVQVTLFAGFFIFLGTSSSSLAAVVPAAIQETDEFYGPIRKCPYGLPDEEISVCLADRVNSMRSLFAKGIPEVDFPSIDPFLMDKFDFVMNYFPLVVTNKFKDIRIDNLSRYDDSKFKVDTKAKTMEFEMSASKLKAAASWSIQGNILPFIFELIGGGDSSIEIDGGRVHGRLQLKIVPGKNGGPKILQVDRCKLDLDYDDSKMEVNGLFNEHPTLKRVGPLVNRISNEYQKEFYHMSKPTLEAYVSEIAKEILNNAFAKMPFMAKYF